MQSRPLWLVRSATFLALVSVAGAAGAQARRGETTNKPTPTSTTTSTTTSTKTTTTTTAEPKPAADDPNTENSRAVYLSADFGFTRPDLGGFSNNLGFDKSAANGFLAGAGVGYRHRALRVGFRFRSQDTTEFTMWSLMGEVGYGFPIKPLTPVIMIHAGYMFDTGIERGAFASQLPATNLLTPNVDLDGLVLGLELNGAYSVTKFLKVGPFLGFDATFLHRAQVRVPQSTQPLGTDVTENSFFGASGSGVGYILNIGIRVTGDIGL